MLTETNFNNICTHCVNKHHAKVPMYVDTVTKIQRPLKIEHAIYILIIVSPAAEGTRMDSIIQYCRMLLIDVQWLSFVGSDILHSIHHQ